jgi:hypothetical protein
VTDTGNSDTFPHRPALTRRAFVSLLTVSGCGVAPTLRGQQNADAGRTTPSANQVERRFKESAAVFANPERGFYAQRRSDRVDRLEKLRDDGISLLLVTFDLRDFRDRAVGPEKLDELRRALETSRDGGFKVLFRAAYGFTNEDYRVDPKDLRLIVDHIAQIGAVLTEQRDLVSGIQAGMLGPWGEWHGSNHGNPPSLESRRAVLFAWLDAVPAPMTVHVRRPMFIRDIFASEPGGATLSDADAFNGSKLSRTGWHNDAFLARPSDLGTYAERGWDRKRELEWSSHHGRFTPFGGETVHSDTPMPIADMIHEIESVHATYLNIGYHPRVVQLWRESEYRGENTFQYIARRLGYRFVAKQLSCPRTVRVGGELALEVTLKNTGFASPHLPRLAEAAIFSADSKRSPARVGLPAIDVRRWGPETGEIRLVGNVRVPADFPRGPCRLALRFADPSDRLREDGRYAIRLANDDIAFNPAGWNILAEDLVCDAGG